MNRKHQTFTCQICGQNKTASEILPANLVRPTIAELIKKEHPDWTSDGFICFNDFNRYRSQYVQQMLEAERGELGRLDNEVIQNLQAQELLSQNVEAMFQRQTTLGQRLADRLASFGGSWTFLLSFSLILIVWLAINSVHLLAHPFDPFPYILLNLVLSCLAAIQAPVIMMSQNRQESKDRLRAENDYRVNLKAELEIRHLHAKIDLLLTHQWQRLLEIQQIQLETMDHLRRT